MGSVTSITSGLNSIVGTLNTVNQTVGLVNSLSGSDQSTVALEQLQERQRLQEQQLAQQNALERERIAVQAAQDEEDRQKALRRAVSRQRASFGGSGVSSAGGSSQAVLLGLFDESEDELRQREELDSLRNRALDLEASQTRSLNLLQATQLEERNSLNRLF